MPIYDVRCVNDHVSEVYVHSSDKLILCPTCGMLTEHIWCGKRAVIGDEIDEVLPDLDPSGPIRFRSRQEKQRYLDAHQLEPFVRNAGPDDKHVPRWATMDAYTLAAAEALVARVGQTVGADPPIRCETLTLSVRDVTLGAEDICKP